MLKSMHTQLLPVDKDQFERIMTILQAQLGPVAFEAALAEGRALTVDQAIELALADEQR